MVFTNGMNKIHKILLVDDDPDILELLEYNFKNEGFETYLAGDGIKAIEKAQKILPDIIVLDIMMPILDGIATATRLRQIEPLKNTIIIFLTARDEEYTELAAFNSGANDFIVKPIKIKPLISRVNAHLNRIKTIITPKNEEKLKVGEIEINRKNHSVTIEGVSMNFPKKEFELLFFLIENPERVFSRSELLSKIWGDDITVIDRTVDVHIRKIREKIGENYIKTFKGVGYLFASNLE